MSAKPPAASQPHPHPLDDPLAELPGWHLSAEGACFRVTFYFGSERAAADLSDQIRTLAADRGVSASFETLAEVRLTTTLTATANTTPRQLLALALAVDRLAAGQE